MTVSVIHAPGQCPPNCSSFSSPVAKKIPQLNCDDGNNRSGYGPSMSWTLLGTRACIISITPHKDSERGTIVHSLQMRKQKGALRSYNSSVFAVCWALCEELHSHCLVSFSHRPCKVSSFI